MPDEISEVIVVIGYKRNLIKSHFGKEWKGKRIRYVIQSDLNGSGGALFCTKDYLKGKFLVLNGDDLYQKSELKKLLSDEPPALLAKQVEEVSRFGAFITDKKSNLLEIIEEVLTMEENIKLVNIGIYFLTKKIFD